MMSEKEKHYYGQPKAMMSFYHIYNLEPNFTFFKTLVFHTCQLLIDVFILWAHCVLNFQPLKKLKPE